MKHFITLFIIAILTGNNHIQAQIYPKTNEEGKFGYIDDKGNIIVPFELQEAGYLKNGMAKFQQNGKYGFINEEGKIVVEPKYEETGSFNEMGYCWVCANGKLTKERVFNGSAYGIINKEGKEIIPAKYAEVGSFCIIIENQKYYMYDGKEHPLATYPHIDACAEQIREKSNWMHIPSSELPISAIPYFWYSQESTNMRVGLVDKEGNIIFADKLYNSVFPPSNGMVLLRINEKGNMYIAYFNVETKELLRLPFDTNAIYHPFKCGVAKVEIKDKGCYFINKKMEKITPTLQSTGIFQDGLCPVQDLVTGLCGVIDSTGTNIVPNIYKSISRQYSEGLLRVQDQNGWGFIDRTGQVIIPLQYAELYDFKFGWSAAKKEGKWGYIDQTGNAVIPLKWESVTLIKKPCPTHVWCKENGKMYSYSYLLQKLNFDQGFDTTYNYDSEQYFIVSNDKKFGVINIVGTEIIPLKLDSYENTVAGIEYMQSLHKSTLDGIDLYRYVLYTPTSATNSFKLSDKISDEMWDY